MIKTGKFFSVSTTFLSWLPIVFTGARNQSSMIHAIVSQIVPILTCCSHHCFTIAGTEAKEGKAKKLKEFVSSR
jgi:hypothetical protein